MNGRYDTVVFDLDGTLMDTLEDLANAVNEILRRYGYPVKTIGEVRRSLRLSIRNIVRSKRSLTMELRIRCGSCAQGDTSLLSSQTRGTRR